jgi:uncharacterized phage protein (TIGR01671 family)
MNQPIRFRAWDDDEKLMVNPDFIDREGMAHYTVHSIPTLSRKVMLSIGITDITGKDVYQGDIVSQHKIVRVPYQEGSRFIKELSGKTLYEITWTDWGCAFHGRFIKHKSKSEYFGQAVGYGTLFLFKDNEHHKLEIEVIGNIFANPELLKT